MRYILILLLFSISCSLFSQHSLTFILKDSITKEVLPGATIILKGTNIGVSTDINGKATLKNVTEKKKLLKLL